MEKRDDLKSVLKVRGKLENTGKLNTGKLNTKK